MFLWLGRAGCRPGTSKTQADFDVNAFLASGVPRMPSGAPGRGSLTVGPPRPGVCARSAWRARRSSTPPFAPLGHPSRRPVSATRLSGSGDDEPRARLAPDRSTRRPVIAPKNRHADAPPDRSQPRLLLAHQPGRDPGCGHRRLGAGGCAAGGGLGARQPAEPAAAAVGAHRPRHQRDALLPRRAGRGPDVPGRLRRRIRFRLPSDHSRRGAHPRAERPPWLGHPRLRRGRALLALSRTGHAGSSGGAGGAAQHGAGEPSFRARAARRCS